MNYPRITVVTPSFNQGVFLEDTIRSVLGQGYPNLEYIIIDGGSEDGSVEIIKKHSPRLAYWQSRPDRGQSDAINIGFRRSTGAILLWLNSDDMLLPGTLDYMAAHLPQDKPAIGYGNCIHYREQDGVTANGSDVVATSRVWQLNQVDYIIQPASCLNRQAWELTGELNNGLHYVFDWHWFLQAEKKGVALFAWDKVLALYRYHADHKSSTGGHKRQAEIRAVYQEFNPEWEPLYSALMQAVATRRSLKVRIWNRWQLLKGRPPGWPAILKKNSPMAFKAFSEAEMQGAGMML